MASIALKYLPKLPPWRVTAFLGAVTLAIVGTIVFVLIPQKQRTIAAEAAAFGAMHAFTYGASVTGIRNARPVEPGMAIPAGFEWDDIGPIRRALSRYPEAYAFDKEVRVLKGEDGNLRLNLALTTKDSEMCDTIERVAKEVEGLFVDSHGCVPGPDPDLFTVDFFNASPK